jgi:hypothetical protein
MLGSLLFFKKRYLSIMGYLLNIKKNSEFVHIPFNKQKKVSEYVGITFIF